jgi:hypothetical protein
VPRSPRIIPVSTAAFKMSATAVSPAIEELGTFW